MGSEIEVRLLGPVAVAGVEFEGAKQRRLFVALALRAPEAVSDDALVEAIWHDDVPDGREQALQKQVSRLRARLGERLPVRRHAAGYALEIDREAIDSRRFEAQLEAVRADRADPAGAAGRLAAALALWRGPALAEHRFDEFAQAEITRYGEGEAQPADDREGRRRPRRRSSSAWRRAGTSTGSRSSPARRAPRRRPRRRPRPATTSRSPSPPPTSRAATPAAKRSRRS
jgi:Transcriptional regulatory protein, C terminal/Bacterial transcriptional activator domain